MICTILSSADDVWLLNMSGFLPVCGYIPADKGLPGSADHLVSSTLL